MGRDRIPDPLTKRALLYGRKLPAETLSRYGDLYLQAEFIPDAVEFFAKAHDDGKLKEILQRAVELGSSFFVRRIERLLPDAVDSALWDRLGDRALAAGKLRDALFAYDRAEQQEKMENVLAMLEPKRDAQQQH